MEIKEVLNHYGIIGVIGNYKSTLDINQKVKDLNINNLEDTLKIVELKDIDINTKIGDLSISEQCKIDLATKLRDNPIIIGNLYNSLIDRDRELIKKILLKLQHSYNKKIIVIDNKVNTFFGLTKVILVLEDKKIIYQTTDFYDEKLYKYTNIPKIIDFVNYVNSKKPNKLVKNLDIYELIKDIYRSIQ